MQQKNSNFTSLLFQWLSNSSRISKTEEEQLMYDVENNNNNSNPACEQPQGKTWERKCRG